MSTSTRSLVALLAAALMGLVVVFLVRGYVNSTRPDPTGQAANAAAIPVVVAAGPIPRGAQLTPAMLKVVRFPADAAPAGAFASTETLLADAEPRRALRPLSPNEPILSNRVSSATTRLNLSAALGDGMRAVSVRVNDVAGVGGFVLPGDRVDVLLTRSPEGDKPAVTQVLAENVLVLGVDQSDDDEADKPVVVRAVTLEVAPDQAQTLSLGGVVGTVSLALRKIEDQTLQAPGMITTADLGLPRRQSVFQPVAANYAPSPRPARARPSSPAPSGPAGPKPIEIKVVRGTETSAYSVNY
ncbi:MAG TPA: Flp pilus assembly protein CpaB [Brevundimonas sp.]|nr:Flp pilus assembly protein CpaB [Brevundimonas sp.]